MMRVVGKHLAELVRSEKRLLGRFVLAALGRAGLSVGVIFLIREFLAGVLVDGADAAAGDSARSTLWLVATLLIVAYVGGSLCFYDNRVSQQRIVQILELGIMERLIRHLLTLSVPFFDRQSHGDILAAVRQDVSNVRIVTIATADLFLEVLTAVGLFAVALWLSPWLTLWALIVLPVAALPLYLIARSILARSYAVRRTSYVLLDLVLQVLRGIRVIKAYHGEENEAQIAVEKGRRYFEEVVEVVRVRSLSRAVLESLAGLGIVIVIVVGGFQVMAGTLIWPNLLAFVMAVRALHGPLYTMNGYYVQMKALGASVDRVAQLLEERPEVIDRPDARPLAAGPQTIAFDDVGFSYTDTAVLRDLSFEVRAGETIGIAGPSGAGKTTLLNLVARFYDPSEGRILFNANDLRQYRVADVHRHLAVVTQDPFIFATTVRENVRCGRPDASDEDVERACRVAGIHEEILALPEGYDTSIGITGHGLSGGQAQRINVARAVLKNAPLLLLDEATSSLDSVTENQVQEAIDRLVEGRTTFVVAHRLSTLRRASRILVLDGGRCVGFASHQELVRTCPLYRRMWNAQQLGADFEPASGDQKSGAARGEETEAFPPLPATDEHPSWSRD